MEEDMKNSVENSVEDDMSSIRIIGHHIRDLSFEIQHPLKFRQKILDTKQDFKPQIKLDIKVQASKFQGPNSQEIHEIELSSKVDGMYQEEKIFLLELLYNGLFVFRYENKEHLEELCMVHAPAIMFPYVRNVVSEITASGGLTPLFLQPIDFQRLYAAKKMQSQAVKN